MDRPEFPAMLYKHGSEIEWDGEHFDTHVVHNADEFDAALKAGWSHGKPSKKAAPSSAKDEDESDAEKGSSKKAK